ncbi:glycine oxidase ThiO [Plantactinospora sp. KBS50]|uniref:glycine oxidase ThiO n=1 Tax=Plantactinospora sp. KBS50 TaxID=2024580 RepID=UPI000BAA9EB3|nr:glycine oxidase ThiO [Plantactinospora sp. KBS50]ASW53580.1 glycine oxidase ThiO [Plantactinospora sp. KBS50]
MLSVVGGGPIGLAIAWRSALRGRTVTVYDPEPGSGASAVAAGMLSPVSEAAFGERELTPLLLDSAARWPAFAAELAVATGRDLGHRTEGTLIVALTADDAAEARRLWTYQRDLGLPLEPLLPGQLREREPALNPRVRAGAYAPGDHQVDPRRLVPALLDAALGAGVTLVRRPVARLADLPAGPVVVAAGTGTAALTGLPIRPVKGQVLRLRAPGGAGPAIRHVLRGHADGRSVYLVPRTDGEVVVGATVEERVDRTVTAGAVLDLLRAATELVPELAEYELVEARAELRPGTPDNLPVLGPLPTPAGGRHGVAVAGGHGHVPVAGGHGHVPVAGGHGHVLVAGGHYRHGIVLTPVTADLIADALTGQGPPDALAAFRPDRFSVPTHRPEPARPAAEGANSWR